jgi:hypothetical protein
MQRVHSAEACGHARARPAALFEQAIALDNKSEDAFFEYARYLDQLMRDARSRQEGRAKSGAASGRAAGAHDDRLGGRAKCAAWPCSPFSGILSGPSTHAYNS